MDNKMKEVCALFGFSFDEPFALMPVYTADRFIGFVNPYHFTDKGLVDGMGAVDNTFLLDLIRGALKAIKLPAKGSDD